MKCVVTIINIILYDCMLLYLAPKHVTIFSTLFLEHPLHVEPIYFTINTNTHMITKIFEPSHTTQYLYMYISPEMQHKYMQLVTTFIDMSTPQCLHTHTHLGHVENVQLFIQAHHTHNTHTTQTTHVHCT